MKADPQTILLIREFRRRYQLEQYTDETLKQLHRAIYQVEKEITRQWGQIGLRTEFNQGRAVTLLEEFRGLTAAIKGHLSKDIARAAGEAAAGSAAYTSRSLSFGGRAANVKAVMLAPGVMFEYWQKTPVGGHLLKDWVESSFDRNTIDKIKQEIGKGLLRAESYEQIAERMSVGFGMTKNEIDTLVRTTIRTAHNEAAERVYSQNKDLFDELRWTAAVNDRTCLLCAALEGKRFTLEAHPPCPVHPRCRCTLLPVLKSLKDLGLTTKDIEEFAAEERIVSPTHKGFRGRALERRGLTMGDWLRSLPKKEQMKYFGPSRFALLESGFVSFNDLVDLEQLRIKTLDELPLPAGMTAAEAVKAATAIVATKPEMNHGQLESLLQYEMDAFIEAMQVSGMTKAEQQRRLKAINRLRKLLKKPVLTLEQIKKMA